MAATSQPSLTRYAWLSIAAAVATIGLKLVAYVMTGSVGLLSDAVESVVNLIGALMALWVLTLAAQDADAKHAHGHSKAEYFSSGVEGSLIIVAAIAIAYAAIKRLLDPQPLEQVGIGLLVSTFASLINFMVARILLKAGKQYRSITLEADAHHLMTDVYTSAGVADRLAACRPHRRALGQRQYRLDRREFGATFGGWPDGCGVTGKGVGHDRADHGTISSEKC